MANISDAYESAPMQLHHIVPIDFKSVEKVPETHAWLSSDNSLPITSQLPVENADRVSMPVVDLMDPDAVKLVGESCETWGVFQVINHGIPSEVFRALESEAKAFFFLDAKEKMKALRTSGGVTGYGVARIAPFFNKVMWHEGFTIMGSPENHIRDIWPDDYHRFCEVMEKYQKAMKELIEKLLGMVFKYLNMPEKHVKSLEFFANQGETAPNTALQLNSYPPCPNPAQVMGIAPHTDSYLLTSLHQASGVNGLQVFKEGIGWVPVEPVEDAVIINVGDMLHIMSNALFPSCLHRGITNKSRHRFSFAYFYGPPTDYCISPIANGGPKRFLPVTVKEFVEMKAKDFEGALSKIMIG